MKAGVNVLKVLACCVLLQFSSAGWCVEMVNPTVSDGYGNTAGGTDALVTGSQNTAFGFNALKNNTSGYDNVAIGYQALLNNSGNTGPGAWYNTAVGHQALYTNTEGFRNVAIGHGALYLNYWGARNIAIGTDALSGNRNGGGNVAIGDGAGGGSMDGSLNTAVGNIALSQNQASNNTALGFEALTSNTSGTRNTAAGLDALKANTTGNWNTSSGESSLLKNTTGQGNSAFGLQALIKSVTGNNNLALGINAGANLTSGSNNVYLANAGAASESSTIRIGSNHTRTFIAGIRARKTGLANAVPVMIDSNGQLGTINSSVRFKKDIKDMNEASHNLMELRPVTYRYKEAGDNGDNPLEYGLIAEEVEKVYPDLVAYGADGKIETVQYHKLTPMLLNELQRLHNSLQTAQSKSVSLESQLKAEQQKNRQLAQEVAGLTAQAGKVIALEKQVAKLQTQAKVIQTLTARLSRIEAGQMVGLNR